MEFLGVTPKTL